MLSDELVWHQPGKGTLSGVYNGKQNVFVHLGRMAQLSNGTFAIDQVDYITENGDLVVAAVGFTVSTNGRSLQHEVASITLAEDGREAVDLAAKNGYDLILMDVQMPVMDGYKATQKIREMEYEQGRGEHVPIIALTAYALRGDRERCLRAGMDHYIAKPFQKNALLAAMAMVLSKARRQVE